MIKLYKARSLLYRRQILQENIRWKALDEIYKIYMLLHRSDLNISENFRQTFSHFLAKFCKNSECDPLNTRGGPTRCSGEGTVRGTLPPVQRAHRTL